MYVYYCSKLAVLFAVWLDYLMTKPLWRSHSLQICFPVRNFISSQMPDRHTKTGRSCWQTARETETKCRQKKESHYRTWIIYLMRRCWGDTHLNRHKVDVDELEGRPNFPIHLQSSPVASPNLLFKVFPPFSLRKDTYDYIVTSILQFHTTSFTYLKSFIQGV